MVPLVLCDSPRLLIELFSECELNGEFHSVSNALRHEICQTLCISEARKIFTNSSILTHLLISDIHDFDDFII